MAPPRRSPPQSQNSDPPPPLPPTAEMVDYCLGHIQPHGVLLAITPSDLTIAQISANADSLLSQPAPYWLGQPLTTLLDPGQIQQFSDTLTQLSPQSTAQFPTPVSHLHLHFSQRPDPIATFLHASDPNRWILELLPASLQTSDFPLPPSPFTPLHQHLTRLRTAQTRNQLLTQAVQEIQALTGFDRILAYQFDPDGSGHVVAEVKPPHAPQSYLGWHYPATDIPPLSRDWYARGFVRFIPNFLAAPVPLLWMEGQAPLDLSLAVLRAADPCCITFHQNMGVAALLVIPLLKGQHLWGLISCHHPQPIALSPTQHLSAEIIGQVISAELATKVTQEALTYQSRLHDLQSGALKALTQAASPIPDTDVPHDAPHTGHPTLAEALLHPDLELLELTASQGAAICDGDRLQLIGQTPSAKAIWDLLDWSDHQGHDTLFHTNALPRIYPPAAEFKPVASGLLVLRISQVRRYTVLWFRPEVPHTITWAGNPQDSLQPQPDGSLQLCPRQSFAQWQELVRDTSLPWQPYEIDSALDLRTALVGMVLNKADELAQINRELQRSNQELASFAYAASHDLKEPLRGIHNYAVFLQEDYANLLDDAGIEKLQTLVRLTQRMESLINALLRFSQVGQAQLQRSATNLQDLLDRVLEVLRTSRDPHPFTIHCPRLLPTLTCDPVLVAEVFGNLISNALKYTDQSPPWVEVGYWTPAEALTQGITPPPASETAQPNRWRSPPSDAPLAPVFYVRDTGIGIREHHQDAIFRLFKRLHPQKRYGGGTGAGLTIVKKIVERHGGTLWLESSYGKGSTFYFTLPQPSPRP